MAFDTFSNLKTAIANYLNRDDLTAFIGDFITLTESRLNRELRVREMISSDTSTTTVSGTQSYSLPTGFLEAKSVVYQSNPYKTLKFISNSDFYDKYNASVGNGQPNFFTIVGTNILLGNPPDSANTLQIDYFKTITPLSDSNPTNSILTNYPNSICMDHWLRVLHLLSKTKEYKHGDLYTKKQLKTLTKQQKEVLLHHHQFRCLLLWWHK